MDPEKNFSKTYSEARRRFRAAAEQFGARLDSSVYPDQAINGQDPIAQDVALFGNPNASHWFVALSGTHGPEGFAGSAIQLDWMKRSGESVPDDVGVALVHGVNPWGFANEQRTTAGDIDLNRNFVDAEFRQSGESPIFAEIAAAMEIDRPSTQAFENFNQLREDLIKKHGRDAYVDAFARGQYSFPHSAFFGGADVDWANASLVALLKKHLRSAEKIALIDWHTGLGEYGELFFLCFNEDEELFQQAVEWWGEPVEIGARGFDNAQRPNYTGTVSQGLIAAFDKQQVVAAVIEIGTYEFSKMSDAILVENWLRSPAGQKAEDRAHWLSWTSEHFNPDDDEWRCKTVMNGRGAMDQAFYGIRSWK